MVVLLTASAYLTFSYFSYTILANTVSNNEPSIESSWPNLFASSNVLFESQHQLKKDLQARMDEEENTLEFMIWPEERRKVLQQSIQTTQHLINMDPIEIRYWQRLLSVQYESNPNSAELSWIIEQLYRLSGWHHRTMYVLARYCIPSVFTQNLKNPLACKKIAANLPFQQQPDFLARQIGISESDLKVFLEFY